MGSNYPFRWLVINAEHSGTKQMDKEGLDSQKLHGAPPLMPWPKFAEWIGMADEPLVVRSWLERGYLPSQKVGKRTMVNVALLHQQLLEQEWTL
ncbi:DNA-binding protein [Pseudomonas fulva]